MHRWVTRKVAAGILTAGCLVVGAGVSSAGTTSGAGGVLSGNQVNAPITVPISACGNSLAAILSIAKSSCQGNSTAVVNSGNNDRTSGREGVGSGNQINAPITAPVTVCGNALAAVASIAKAHCQGNATALVKSGNGNKTSGEQGVLSGNQITAPITAPVTVCGNALAAVASIAKAHCQGNATALVKTGNGNTTSGREGVLSGNQVNIPVTVPVTVCGNAVALIASVAKAHCQGNSTAIVDGGCDNHGGYGHNCDGDTGGTDGGSGGYGNGGGGSDLGNVGGGLGNLGGGLGNLGGGSLPLGGATGALGNPSSALQSLQGVSALGGLTNVAGSTNMLSQGRGVSSLGGLALTGSSVGTMGGVSLLLLLAGLAVQFGLGARRPRRARHSA